MANAQSIVLLVLLVASACEQKRSPAAKLESFGSLPTFSLRDDKGAAFTQGDMAGRVSIVNFVFTRCDALCPALTARMKWLDEQVANQTNPPQFVSISVDPKHDTPEVLAAYRKKRRLDSPRWHFVTGDSQTIQSMVKESFFMMMERRGETASGAPNIVHSDRFLLIDPSLHIRGFYHSDDQAELRKLLRHAAQYGKASRQQTARVD